MKKWRAPLLAAIIVFLSGIVLGSISGILWTQNPYNSYSLQAARWLSGHLDLGQNYAHLEIATFMGRHFISFPPFPSVVLLPFVLLFGIGTPDALISILFAAGGGGCAAYLAKQNGKSETEAVFLALFVSIGSNLLSVMCTGWVWFMAQTMAFAFLMAAFCTAKKGKTAWTLFLLACAVGCRPFSVLCLPVFLYLLYMAGRRLSWKTVLYAMPAAAVIFFYLLLNALRFDNPFEFGHNYLPEFLAEPQFGLWYVPENAKTLFRLPIISDGKLVFPMFNGFAFFLASPIFISYGVHFLRAKKKGIDYGILALLVLWLLLFCMHRTMGGWHFGHRYTLDLLPLAFFGLLHLGGGKIKWQLPLSCMGTALHVYGFLLLLSFGG